MLKLTNITEDEFFTSSENYTSIQANFNTFILTVIHNGQCIHLGYDQYDFTFDNIVEEILFKRLSIFDRIFGKQSNGFIINSCLFLDDNQKEFYRLKYA